MRKIELIMYYIKLILKNKGVQTILIGGIVGGLLQIFAQELINSDPEFYALPSESEDLTEKPYKRRTFWSFHGGSLVDVEINLLKFVVNLLSKQGVKFGIMGTSAFVLGKIPLKEISKYLANAFPQNLPHLKGKKYILNDETMQITLDQCEDKYEYLHKIFKDKNIPFKEKENFTRLILTQHVDLKDMFLNVRFIMCMVSLISLLWFNDDLESIYILFKTLIEAIRQGVISKAVGRVIIRKLLRQGVKIDPELLRVVSEEVASPGAVDSENLAKEIIINVVHEVVSSEAVDS